MFGIYLAAFKAYHPNHKIVYQDINGKRDIGGDMMEVDLADYDYIIEHRLVITIQEPIIEEKQARMLKQLNISYLVS